MRMFISGAAAVAVAGCLGLTATGGAKADDHMVKLTVVERAASDTVTDTGDKGDTVGDILTFANEVYDEGNTKLVGHDNGWCVRTLVGKAWECFWTLALDDGQITVEGPFLDAGDSNLAVTGGTGEYSGVRGEMKLHSRNDKGTEYDFIYNLIKD